MATQGERKGVRGVRTKLGLWDKLIQTATHRVDKQEGLTE